MRLTLVIIFATCVSVAAQPVRTRVRLKPPSTVDIADSFTGATFYVNTESTAGGDGTTAATSGSNRAWATLKEALEHASFDTNAPRRIFCSGTNEDTQQVIQTTWNSVSTDPTTPIYIIGNNSTKGRWNDTAYRLANTNVSIWYNNQPGHGVASNLQIRIVGNGSQAAAITAMRLSTANVGSGRTDCSWVAADMVIQIESSSTLTINGFYESTYAVNDSANKVRHINCLVYTKVKGAGSSTVGFGSAWQHVDNFNCTSISNTDNFLDPQKITNCIAAFASSANFNNVETGGGGGNYNATTGSGAPGANSRVNQTFTFVDINNRDFRLSTSDAGAKGFGQVKPLGTFYTTDVLGTDRGSSTWSIGYHEP